MSAGKKNEIQQSLTRIGAQSEKHFLTLAAGFPRLMQELRRGLSSASAEIARISEGSETHQSSEVGSVWHGAEKLLHSSSNHFRSLSTRDEHAFQALRTGINTLNDLNGSILDLREDALDIEVLALNAIVAARKAGEDGQGFAIVASELQHLATATVVDTDALRNSGSQVLESLQAFQAVVAKIEGFERNFFDRFAESLGTGLRDLRQAFETLIGRLSTTIEKAQGVEAPLKRIMAEIQIQDIIVQSLAHVHTVVDESKEEEVVVAGDGTPVSLNRLCVTLLKEVQEKLSSTVSTFRSNFDALQAIVTEVRSDLHPSHDSAGKSADRIVGMFDEPLQTLSRITADIETALTKREELRSAGSAITQEVEAVLNQISELSKYVERLYPLQIMSRIEVNKFDQLAGNLFATDGIEELIGRVREDIMGSESELAEGLSEIEHVVAGYVRGDTANHSRGIATEIKELSGRLREIQGLLAEGLQHFLIFSDQAVDLMKDAQSEVEGLESLGSDIDRIMTELEQLCSESEANSAVDLKSTPARETVASLLDQFTIARHKTTAADLVGIAVEAGGDEGELTLF